MIDFESRSVRILEQNRVVARSITVLPGRANDMRADLFQEFMRFIDVGYHDYEGVALNLEEQERVVRDLGGREAMILRNHGLLVTGASIAEGFNNIFRLERACQLQVMALSCNTELSLPPRATIEATNKLYQPGVRRRFGLMEWPALLKKLDKLDPSYRE